MSAQSQAAALVPSAAFTGRAACGLLLGCVGGRSPAGQKLSYASGDPGAEWNLLSLTQR